MQRTHPLTGQIRQTTEQSQAHRLTPALQESLQWLACSTPELEARVQAALDDNPLLERAPQSEERTEEDGVHALLRQASMPDSAPAGASTDRTDPLLFVARGESLREHLLAQLPGSRLLRARERIGRYLIECVDENGYLQCDPQLAAERFATDPGAIQDLIAALQAFDPPGVAARDLTECLLIQTRQAKSPPPATEDILRTHLEDLAKNRMTRIAQALGRPLEDIAEGARFIRTLCPKPGAAFQQRPNPVYVRPDVTLHVENGTHHILVNESSAPRLRISDQTRAMLANADQDEAATAYLKEKMESALRLIANIEQRRDTLYRVVEALLTLQPRYLTQGESGLRPLRLCDVAAKVGLHQSTVSRATRGKFLQTPRGLVELKRFFPSGVPSEGHESSSSTIKDRIRRWIEEEDPYHPLSDQQLADQLREKELPTARRTVAKYREELGFPSSRRRRRY